MSNQHVSSVTLGDLRLPPGFPVAEFDRVDEWMSARGGNPPDSVWFAFASAWNAVAYRLKGAAEHCAALCDSFARSSSAAPKERWRQEHDLLGFAATATSALECCCFAAYCVGHIIDPARFPMTKPKNLNVYAWQVVPLFQAGFPGELLADLMNRVVNASEYQQLKVFRDVLLHRGTPPRMHSPSTGPDLPSTIPSNLKDLAKEWTYDTDLSSTRTTEAWMRIQVFGLIIAIDQFTQSHAGTRRLSSASPPQSGS